MNRRHWKLPVFLLAFALAAPFALAADCPRLVPDILPAYSFSGAWIGDTLTLVDTQRDTLLRYDATGRYVGDVSPAKTTGVAPYPPSAIATVDGRSFLQMWSGRFVEMDARAQPQLASQRRLIRAAEESVPKTGEDVRAVYSWDVGGDALVVCGDVKDGDNWSAAFLRVPLQTGKSDLVDGVEVLGDRWGVMDPEPIYCRIGYDFIATDGDDTYIIYDDGAGDRIHHFVGAKQAPSLATDIGDRPELWNYEGDADFADLLEKVERSTMPAGLYFWNGSLYLLSRKPRRGGGTEWSLTVIDPKSGEDAGSGVLPTRASHLTVVPGDRSWAVVEKGPVMGFDDQRTLGLRLVPAEAILALSEGGSSRICR